MNQPRSSISISRSRAHHIDSPAALDDLLPTLLIGQDTNETVEKSAKRYYKLLKFVREVKVDHEEVIISVDIRRAGRTFGGEIGSKMMLPTTRELAQLERGLLTLLEMCKNVGCPIGRVDITAEAQSVRGLLEIQKPEIKRHSGTRNISTGLKEDAKEEHTATPPVRGKDSICQRAPAGNTTGFKQAPICKLDLPIRPKHDVAECSKSVRSSITPSTHGTKRKAQDNMHNSCCKRRMLAESEPVMQKEQPVLKTRCRLWGQKWRNDLERTYPISYQIQLPPETTKIASTKQTLHVRSHTTLVQSIINGLSTDLAQFWKSGNHDLPLEPLNVDQDSKTWANDLELALDKMCLTEKEGDFDDEQSPLDSQVTKRVGEVTNKGCFHAEPDENAAWAKEIEWDLEKVLKKYR